MKFYDEIQCAHHAREAKEYQKQWAHLERAHILGQHLPLRHLMVHVLMMGFSLRHLRAKEFLGQIPRIILAVPGSMTGKAPRGNTGGANVGIFTPMEIPEDLKSYLEWEPASLAEKAEET